MTVLGFCTHFSDTDEWAFSFALQLAKKNGWQLNICHWLDSPYNIRRDIVHDDLFKPQRTLPITPQLLNKLEYQLRAYYDPRLGDFTDVAFKLCEGQYQIELVRCLRRNLLDLLVMGYQTSEDNQQNHGISLIRFAESFPYPLVIVGQDGAGSFLLNKAALDWLQEFSLPVGSWQVIEPISA